MLREVLLLTGTVGVGKTTTAIAVARLLAEAGTPSGCVDLDVFSRRWPPPDDDPFRTRLALANLASCVPNFASAGAEVLVLAWVVEDRAQAQEVRAAVEPLPLRIVRLMAPHDVVEARLRARHVGVDGADLDWHLRRFGELDRIIDDSDLGALPIQAAGSVEEVARRVVTATGLLPR